MPVSRKVGTRHRTPREGGLNLIEHALKTFRTDKIKKMNEISPFEEDFIRLLVLKFHDCKGT